MSVTIDYRHSKDRFLYKTKYKTDLQSFFFNYAKKEAYKSDLTNKHGCVIVKNGKIISQGHNTYCDTLDEVKSIHAEIMALNKIKYIKDLSSCDMYIVRVSKVTDDLMFSKPCNYCYPILNKTNLHKIYYSY
jgi:tRNA(Arg) A34 adenosine deaminase TadA